MHQGGSSDIVIYHRHEWSNVRSWRGLADHQPEGPLIMPDMPLLAFPTLQDHPPRLTTPADLDRQLHALQSRFTGGRSPSTVALACLDWAAHAANSPFQAASWGESAV